MAATRESLISPNAKSLVLTSCSITQSYASRRSVSVSGTKCSAKARMMLLTREIALRVELSISLGRYQHYQWVTCYKTEHTSFWLEYTASASNPSSPWSLSFMCLLIHMYPLSPRIRSTPHGKVMKCDLRRRTNTEGTTMSWPFRNFGNE